MATRYLRVPLIPIDEISAIKQKQAEEFLLESVKLFLGMFGYSPIVAIVEEEDEDERQPES